MFTYCTWKSWSWVGFATYCTYVKVARHVMNTRIAGMLKQPEKLEKPEKLEQSEQPEQPEQPDKLNRTLCSTIIG